ncbi:MAG: galactonate dehydratase [Anaerolineae bacterium]|nr:galactonate dehydratase [Anaerolineae bacterium]
MKIVGIETYLAPFSADPTGPGNRNIPFVRVLTDEGIHGVGEAFTVGPDLATVKAIDYFAEWLVGRDPMDIEGLWQLMYNGSRFPTGSLITAAISGIEHALWDIKGKALNVPVYQLVGGKCRDRVRVYQGVGGRTPEELAASAVALVEKYGYTGLKTSPWPHGERLWHDMGFAEMVRGAETQLETLREAVGDAVDIGLDAHAQAFEPAKALALCRALEPYRPLFMEEPLRAENRRALGHLRSKSPIPIATGEALFTKFEFRDLFAHQAVDIVQPDICIVGGLWEMKKIAAMAEAEYVVVAPHNPCGPIANAVNFHFALSTQNFLILEYRPDDVPHRRNLIDEPIPLKDGYLLPPDRPGLGVDLVPESFKDYQYHAWHRPFLWRVDGSFGHQ